MNYLFKSERLGFRNWTTIDIPLMAEINADKEVMKHFPKTATHTETKEFIEKMQTMFTEKGFCYFAVDLLEDSSFIGFIGLSVQHFEAEFTPCIDIGWRLSKSYWKKGYATEGAKKCLEYAFKELNLSGIKAIAPLINLSSINIMEKIGMEKQLEFKHPKLLNNKRLVNCACYEIGQN